MSLCNILTANKKDLGRETFCPFNNKWCSEKQNLLNRWRYAIKNYSDKEREEYLLYSSADMFDGCPEKYVSLCTTHIQKQRD